MTTASPPQVAVAQPGYRRSRSSAALAWVRGRRLSNSWPPLASLAAVFALIALQSQLFVGQERTVTTVFMFITLAQGWNIIGGFTGYACFGQVVFFGVGGYSTAVLMSQAGMGFWAALPLAVLVAVIFAVFVGVPLLRLRGHYFAIATLGVAEGTREIITNLPGLTGGGAGITVPTFGPQAGAYPGNDGFYIIFMLLAVASVSISALLSRSRFGYAMRAINQDEDAAGAVGIDTTRVKVIAFAVSAAFTGAAGAVYAYQQISIYPERLFDVEVTVLMVVMVVIGGSGSVMGALVGAVCFQFLFEYLRQTFTTAHTFILGAVIIAAVIFFPQGIVTFVRDAWRTRHVSFLDTIRTYRL